MRTNGWVADAGGNWSVNAYDGNPTYCAEFYWYPELTSYSYSLTSKSFTGVGSPSLKLYYDIYLNNFSTSTLEQMAVEILNGSTWQLLKNYDNSGGSISWKTENIDLCSYTNKTFKIRFRAYGEDTYELNNWDIDNVKIVAGAQTTGPKPLYLRIQLIPEQYPHWVYTGYLLPDTAGANNIRHCIYCMRTGCLRERLFKPVVLYFYL